MEQSDRFTVVVLLQNKVTKDQIDKAMTQIEIKVDIIHPSKDSYHLSK